MANIVNNVITVWTNPIRATAQAKLRNADDPWETTIKQAPLNARKIFFTTGITFVRESIFRIYNSSPLRAKTAWISEHLTGAPIGWG
jgi:hypothetical protein